MTLLRQLVPNTITVTFQANKILKNRKRSAAAQDRRVKKREARRQAHRAAMQASTMNLEQPAQLDQPAQSDIKKGISTPSIQLKLPNPTASIKTQADEDAWETWTSFVFEKHSHSLNPDLDDYNWKPLSALVQSSDRVTYESITHSRMVLHKANRQPSTANPLVSKLAIPSAFQQSGFTTAKDLLTKPLISHHNLLAQESMDEEAQSSAIANPVPTFEKILQFLDAFNKTSGAPPLALVAREMPASVSNRLSTPIPKLTIAATEHSPPPPHPPRFRLTSSLPASNSPVLPKLQNTSSPLSASFPHRVPSPWLGLPYTPQIPFPVIDTTEDKDEPTESKPPLQPHEIIEISDDEESIQLKPSPHKFCRSVRYHEC